MRSRLVLLTLAALLAGMLSAGRPAAEVVLEPLPSTEPGHSHAQGGAGEVVARQQLSGTVRTWDRSQGRNLPDDRRGYQIQLVHVTTPSATGQNYDTDGRIASWVSSLQDWLSQKVGDRLVFDTYQGRLDIPRLHVAFNVSLDDDHSDEKALVALYREINEDSYRTKTVVFIMDQSTSATDGYCGYAPNPGDYAVILPGLERCGDSERYRALNSGLSFPGASILHEVLHSYGVGHVCVDVTDLLIGSPECGDLRDHGKATTLDATRTLYLGGDGAGVDLRTLRIWESGRGERRPELRKGTCWRGETCVLQDVYFTKKHVVHLQVLRGRVWRTVARVTGTRGNSRTDGYNWAYSFRYAFNREGETSFRLYIPPSSTFRAYTGKPQKIRVLD